MPKSTFYHLKAEKRERIVDVLRKTFQKKTIFEANVKDIVEELGIARGSFYQYFDNLEDSYYMILDLETVDIHHLFVESLEKNTFQLYDALEDYGKILSEFLFSQEAYMIYKNRYLYWTPDLEEGWLDYQSKKVNERSSVAEQLVKTDEAKEKMELIKAVVHSLIKRSFYHEWEKNTFLEKYKQHVYWLCDGIGSHNKKLT